MKKIIALFWLCFALAFSASAQTAAPQLTLSSPNTSLLPGSPFVLNVSVAGSSGTITDGIQFSFPVPPGWTFAAAVGAGEAAQGKQLFCNTANSLETCIMIGVVQANTILDGVIASFTSTVPTNQAAGNVNFALSGLYGADTNGSAVTVGTTGPFVLAVTAPISPCDLDGSGATNSTDVSIAISQAIGKTACTTGDLDKNGICNVVDVEIVRIAAAGGACKP